VFVALSVTGAGWFRGGLVPDRLRYQRPAGPCTRRPTRRPLRGGVRVLRGEE